MVERLNPLPLHAQVADAIRAQIRRGDYTPGAKLPDELTLADTFQVTRATVRAALAQLREEGRIVTRRGGGGGSTVTAPKRLRRYSADLTTPSDQRGFYALIAAEGKQPDVRTEVAHERVPADIADLLDIDPGEIVLVRRRVMGAQGERPLQTAASYIPGHVETRVPILAEPVTGPGGMLARLEDAGYGPLSYSETITARPATADEHALGLVIESFPVVIDATGLNYAADGTPLHVMVRAIDAARTELHYTFGAVPSPSEHGEEGRAEETPTGA